MASKNEEIITIQTSKELYSYKALPFNLKNTSVTLEKAMDKIFDDLLFNNIECYVDGLAMK
jgi:hypothetical protein